MSCKKKTRQHVYIDQRKKVVEKVEAQGFLYFFYTTFLGKFLRPLISNHFWSKFVGWYQSTAMSRKKISKFINKHHINMSDFVVPAQGYQSFNDFFKRSLKQGVREIDSNPRALISPADGKCWVVPEVNKQSTFFIKQKKFSLQSLLRDKSQAEYFTGGVLLLLRLAPYDYHRFHAPLNGLYEKPRRIGGILESVNPLVYKMGNMPLVENERDIFIINSQEFGCRVGIAIIGATCVGKINYSASLPTFLTRGLELGFFEFGASSVVILLPPGFFNIRSDLVSYTLRGFEVAVKMGESLGLFV